MRCVLRGARRGIKVGMKRFFFDFSFKGCFLRIAIEAYLRRTVVCRMALGKVSGRKEPKGFGSQLTWSMVRLSFERPLTTNIRRQEVAS
jgi:hypothetical protein